MRFNNPRQLFFVICRLGFRRQKFRWFYRRVCEDAPIPEKLDAIQVQDLSMQLGVDELLPFCQRIHECLKLDVSLSTVFLVTSFCIPRGVPKKQPVSPLLVGIHHLAYSHVCAPESMLEYFNAACRSTTALGPPCEVFLIVVQLYCGRLGASSRRVGRP